MAGWTFAFCVVALGIFVSADTVVYPESYNGVGSRIVSGWEAAPGQFPFQLSLRMVNNNGGVTACGASIIHEKWGMTAAHCTALRTTIVIRAGTVNLTRPSVLFETTEYYNHPSYNDAIQSIVQANDIALLKFPIKLKFNELIQPIRLQRDEHKNLNYDGVRMEAAGWGQTWTQGTSPENMNWVYLLGNSNAACRLAFNFSPIIVDSTICASGYNVTSQSTCQGDSGGTLTVYEEDGIRTLVGVTSFVSGSGCHTNVPAGFIRPGHYHDWYRQVTGIDFDWEPVAEESSEEDAATTPAPEESSEEVKPTKAPEVSSEESSESSSNSSEPSNSSSSESSSNSSEPSSSSSSESSSNSSEPSSSSSSESSIHSSEPSSSSSSESDSNE